MKVYAVRTGAAVPIPRIVGFEYRRDYARGRALMQVAVIWLDRHTQPCLIEAW